MQENPIERMDLVYIIVIISLLAVLVFGVIRPEAEPYTEFYFEDFRSLPDFGNSSVDFSYNIRNAEGADLRYRVDVYVEYFSSRTNKFTKGYASTNIVTVPNGKIVTQKITMPLSAPFEKARITAEITDKDQRLHFWIGYSTTTYVYEGFGNATISCLTPFLIGTAEDTMIISARGTYARGWPEITIIHNGKKIDKVKVESNITQNYTVDIPPSLDNVIELVYDNDYYNETNAKGEPIPEDRNLFIEGVRIANYKLPESFFFVEPGLPAQRFDCQKITYGSGAMRSPSSFRFRYRVATSEENVTTL